MTNRLPRTKRQRSSSAWSMLIFALATSSACNRAEPAKESSKADQPAPPPSVLASSKNPASQSVLPSEPGSAVSPPSSTIVPVTSNATPANDASATANPGVHIENLTTSSPSTDTEQTPAAAELSQRLSDRLFMKLDLPKAALAPDQLFAFLGECDRAVQDLAMTRQAKQLSESEFLEQAKRLSNLKLQASDRLFADATATVAQKKTAIAAKVESLSQLTGLGDVDAAQKLLQVAGELTKSPDAQLAHQGRLVLMGFRLNQLIEGQIKDPQVILEDVNSVLDKSEYRGLVELLALQQSLGVLNQLGYAEQAKQVEQRIVKEFRNSADKELAMRAWMIEVGNSQELKAAYEAIQRTLSGEEKDATKVATAANNFIAAHPSLNTVAYFLKVIIDLEYSGQVTAARELSSVVASAKSKFPAGPLVTDIDNVLDGHSRRLGALGKPLVLDQLTGMDGAPFDWSVYRNKVVLVYFWASWEVPSLQLIDQIKKLRERVTDPGFEVVGICTDDGRTISNAEQLVSRQGLSWRNVRSSNPQAVGLDSAVAKALGVNAYSHFALLVDQKGTVRAVHPSFDNLDAMIGELLKQ